MPAADRTEANYRRYAARHVERLRFIRNCRALDMTHDQIRTLLCLSDTADGGGDAIHALVDTHIAHVDARIGELKQLKAQLTALREQGQAAQAVEDGGTACELAEMEVSAPHSRHTRLG